MAEFLNMGGYAGFVWPSWGLAVLVIVAVTGQSIIKARQIKTALAKKDAEKNG